MMISGRPVIATIGLRPRVLIIALALLAIVSTVLAMLIALRSLDQPSQAGTGSGTALIGGPFTALDQTGRAVTEADFKGRWTVWQFGYTFCPDVCPLGLQKLTEALESLPADLQKQYQPIFVTVDPARDTVPVMASYVSNFYPGMIGLTGTQEQITGLTRAWRVYARKADGGGENYLVDHSAFTYIMDPDGKYVTHMGHDATAAEIAARLRDLVARTS